MPRCFAASIIAPADFRGDRALVVILDANQLRAGHRGYGVVDHLPGGSGVDRFGFFEIQPDHLLGMTMLRRPDQPHLAGGGAGAFHKPGGIRADVAQQSRELLTGFVHADHADSGHMGS